MVVIDASAELKTAENIKAITDKVLRILQEEWEVTVITVSIDASGEC